MESEYKDYGYTSTRPLQAMIYLASGVLQIADSLQGQQVLDVGCGDGYLANFVKKAGASSVLGFTLLRHWFSPRQVYTNEELYYYFPNELQR